MEKNVTTDRRDFHQTIFNQYFPKPWSMKQTFHLIFNWLRRVLLSDQIENLKSKRTPWTKIQ